MYIIRDHEAGNEITKFQKLSEAIKCVGEFVNDDIANKIYTENFYEIYNDTTDEIVVIA